MKLVDYRTATEANGFIKDCGNMVNCFGGNFDDFISEIIENKENLKNFTILASALGLCMGHYYNVIERGSHWDDRNKASLEYCGEHYTRFRDLFTASYGTEMPFKDDGKHFNRAKLNEALSQEIEDFRREHSTLQQKMWGLFLKVLYKANIMTDITKDVRFPFI